MDTSSTGTATTETHRHAITAMFFAVFSWLGLFVIGPVLAIVFGGKALADLDAKPGRGRELAASARTIGLVSLVVQLVAGALVGLLVLLAANATDDAVNDLSKALALPTQSASAAYASSDEAKQFLEQCERSSSGGSCGCLLAGLEDAGATKDDLLTEAATFETNDGQPSPRIEALLSGC